MNAECKVYARIITSHIPNQGTGNKQGKITKIKYKKTLAYSVAAEGKNPRAYVSNLPMPVLWVVPRQVVVVLVPAQEVRHGIHAPFSLELLGVVRRCARLDEQRRSVVLLVDQARAALLVAVEPSLRLTLRPEHAFSKAERDECTSISVQCRLWKNERIIYLKECPRKNRKRKEKLR